jgi:polyisoprenoid-binding protein YceI
MKAIKYSLKAISLIIALFFTLSTAQASEIDLSKSYFQWTGSKITGSKHTGKIKLKSANVANIDQHHKGTEFVVDMGTISVEDLKGEDATKFLKHITSADFFDIGKFPVAKLVVEKIENDTLHGKLTIKDKTHAIKVPVKKTGNTYTAELKFDRTKFNMVYGSQNFFKNLGDKVISDEVSLMANFVFK